ncbi:unnamed protein product [Caenorhabditis bovis]|uniref:Protein kinase domain-containing protein n=1 Tax=Caenorhabditis bovis TaxID=2654633 RepID=A0A8S1EKJ6_9PELO|nr:unnamed protein product [Caenorhabditis bovis]
MSCEKDDLIFNIGDSVAGYKIVEKIDEGGFGQVFKVVKGEKIYAMKIESNMQEGGSAIKLEIDVLMELKAKKISNFPMVYQAGKKTKYHFLVMELLGENLKSLRFKSSNPDSLTPSTWSRIGIQCLYVIKLLHDCGFVHRDIKPSNFAMGLGNDDVLKGRIVYLFDFGLARRFVLKYKPQENGSNRQRKGFKDVSVCVGIDEKEPKKEKGSLMERKKTKEADGKGSKIAPSSKRKIINASPDASKYEDGTKSVLGADSNINAQIYRFRIARPHTDFRGTQQYASPNAHAQIELGRADDVWSLMYMLAEMTNPLPWALRENEELPIDDLKNQTPLNVLFKDGTDFTMKII